MSKPAVFVHSFHHFRDVQLSAQDFYRELQDAIQKAEFPQVDHGLTYFSDRGWFSTKRDYLEIRYHRYRYYVCAAPFGRNFFISWWLKEEKSEWERFVAWITGGDRQSFYQIDSAEIFSSSIVSLIKTRIRQIESEQGLRELDSAATA
ncbi:hypothetical protein KXD93_16625 [Mucilaginibacter sp. BJC16-A38]|uniref:hypothetical protein n=1 Tax=Mucilaginibacter phenanthrenivorans TaxID=1234842 RepID=UPI0021576898|nr:hypothetical protein [Mucilaginibacter phenanthrenivorans]MCR8559284.1 hypothetical protein [Mucilaginibacter phenanthrenivorans]